MSTAEPINEAQNLSSMADDVLRAILARARFDDQAALKRVCKRFLAVITSRSFREERRASGCLAQTVLVQATATGRPSRIQMRDGSAGLLAPRQGPRVLCTLGTVAFLGAPLATPLAMGPGPRWSP